VADKSKKQKKPKRGATKKTTSDAEPAKSAEHRLHEARGNRQTELQLLELRRLVQEADALLSQTLATLRGADPGLATGVVLTVERKGNAMTDISIDHTAATITVSFVDSHGESTTAPADLGTLTFTSDNPSVATVAPDPYNPLVGKITPMGVGTANLGIEPLLDRSGVAVPLPTPAPTPVTVVAGAAASVVLTINP
jgi:hypothetical protein